jgi:hypothetical protein
MNVNRKLAPLPKLSDDFLKTEVNTERQEYISMFDSCCGQPHIVANPVLITALRNRLTQILDHFMPSFVFYDRLAIVLQRKHNLATVAVYLLAALAVLFISVQYIFHLPRFIAAGELICITMILVIFHWANHKGWKQNWVNCRLLSERIRFGILTTFLTGEVSSANEKPWTSQGLVNACAEDDFKTLWRNRPSFEDFSVEALPILKELFRQSWLHDQKVFHDKTEKRESRKHKHISSASETFFWLTFGVALLHLAPNAWYSSLHIDHDFIHRLLTLLGIGFPAMGTALAGMRSHFEHKKLANRSNAMIRCIDGLHDHLETISSIPEFERVILEAESLMLNENTDWHLIIGSTEPETPA